MKTGIITFQRYHGRKQGTIGSSVLRGDWLVENWEDAGLWHEGEKFDAMIFQKVYWRQYMESYDGIKILDICDPDWLGGDLNIKEMSLLVDAITCSSEALSEFVRGLVHNIPVITVPDRINFNVFKSPKKHIEKAKTVVWFGYSHNARDVLPYVLPALSMKDLSLLVVSDNKYDTSTNYGVDIKNVKWNPDTAYEEIKTADIALNPSSYAPRFKYKSNNKTLTAWALGLPVANDEDDLDRFIGLSMVDGKKTIDIQKGIDARNKEVDEKLGLLHREYDIKKSVEQYKELIWQIKQQKERSA